MALLKELTALTFSVNESAGEFVLALMDTGTNAVVGYYVSDDEDVTKNKNKAYKYKSKKEAEAEAKLCNNQWDLDGQQFKVVELTEGAIAEEEKHEYDGSNEYDDDQNNILHFLDQALKIARSPAFKKHMRDTDANYSTSATQMARTAEQKLNDAMQAYEDLYEHMMEAS